MSKEQFKKLKEIVLKFKPVVKFENRTKMTQKEKTDEQDVGEALSRTGLIYDSVPEVKQENLRSEGMSE